MTIHEIHHSISDVWLEGTVLDILVSEGLAERYAEKKLGGASRFDDGRGWDNYEKYQDKLEDSIHSIRYPNQDIYSLGYWITGSCAHYTCREGCTG